MDLHEQSINTKFKDIFVKSHIIDDCRTLVFVVILILSVSFHGVASESIDPDADSIDIINYVISNNINISSVEEVYLTLIVEHYGNMRVLTIEQTEDLINSIEFKEHNGAPFSTNIPEYSCSNISHSNAWKCVTNMVRRKQTIRTFICFIKFIVGFSDLLLVIQCQQKYLACDIPSNE